jgi:putative ABC transport system substrate-binding protein
MKGNIDAYWMLPDGMIITPQSIEYLILFSMQNRIPVFTFSEKYLRMGAFLSLEVNTLTMGKQAGEMARKILSGASVGDLPRMDASDTILTVNQKVAQKLGISVSSETFNKIGASR